MNGIVCVGETMVLVTPVEAGRLADADRCRLTIGGAESNVALYLAELGHPVRWASRIRLRRAVGPSGALLILPRALRTRLVVFGSRDSRAATRTGRSSSCGWIVRATSRAVAKARERVRGKMHRQLDLSHGRGFIGFEKSQRPAKVRAPLRARSSRPIS